MQITKLCKIFLLFTIIVAQVNYYKVAQILLLSVAVITFLHKTTTLMTHTGQNFYNKEENHTLVSHPSDENLHG